MPPDCPARNADCAGERRTAGLQAAGWSLIDQSLVSAANFLSFLLLARHMEATQFGLFTLAFTGLMLLNSLQHALLTQPHNVLGVRVAGNDYARFTTALSVAQLCFSLLLAGSVALAALLLGIQFPAPAAVLLAVAGAAVPCMAQEYVRRLLYTRSAAASAAINDAVTYGLQLGGVLYLALQTTVAITAGRALTVLALSSLAGAVLGVGQLYRQGALRWDDRLRSSLWSSWREVWHCGRWLLGQSIVTWFGANGHAWVVAALLGPQPVGFYRAAIHLVNVINPLRQAAYAYLPARGSLAYQTGGEAGLARWVRRVCQLLFLPLVPVAAVLIAWPDQVLELVYGRKFAGLGLGTVLALATVAQIVAFLRYPMEVAILASGSSRALFNLSLLPIGLLLSLGVLLIELFGLPGVPLSGIVIGSVLLGATFLVYRRRLAIAPASAFAT